MITLKKSFELKNYLSSLLETARDYLSDSAYLTKTELTHYRNKVYEGAEDEIIEQPKPNDFDVDVNDLLSFTVYLISEIEKLTYAINDNKHWGVKDFDGMVSVNNMKRLVLNELSNMLDLKSKERTIIGRATKFNEAGEQVSYSYDVKEVKTIDFDRKYVKKISKVLREETEKTSEEIEKTQLNRTFDFDTIFTIGDSFEEALETFLDYKNKI